ncbi:hypothetical protein BN381_400009 [Candidatus Microthrix parvicella RN1]|uniref:Uncharacterized protein n=1 Tax=Candidatus Neomicrothrix parvicella RN1 TaxID=1229780 RepID=R4Z599_9ACTN|nr:hypothetical protein BN381_400009 [Candidatus Microthrix parvicella RN1]
MAPERLADLEGVVELSAACCELQPGGGVLLLLPTDSHPQIEPPAGQHVERRCGLGKHHWPSQCCEQDAGAQTHPGGLSGQERQGRQRLQPVPVGSSRLASTLGTPTRGVCIGLGVLPKHHMVRKDDPVNACGVGGDGRVDQPIPPAGVIRRKVSGLNCQLWSRGEGLPAEERRHLVDPIDPGAARCRGDAMAPLPSRILAWQPNPGVANGRSHRQDLSSRHRAGGAHALPGCP